MSLTTEMVGIFFDGAFVIALNQNVYNVIQ